MTITADQLVDFHNICALKYRYARALDTQGWALLQSCFTDNVVLWPGGEAYAAHGIEQTMALVRALAVDSFYSEHIVSQPEIEFVDESFAKGIWRLSDTLIYTEPLPAITHMTIKGGEVLSGTSIYYDEYTRTESGWRIWNSGYRPIFYIDMRLGDSGCEIRSNPYRGRKGPSS